MRRPSKKLNVEHSPFERAKNMTLSRKAGMLSLASIQRLEQFVGREGSGLKARNLIAWAEASPTSAGPGNLPPNPTKVCKTDTNLNLGAGPPTRH